MSFAVRYAFFANFKERGDFPKSALVRLPGQSAVLVPMEDGILNHADALVIGIRLALSGHYVASSMTPYAFEKVIKFHLFDNGHIDLVSEYNPRTHLEAIYF